MAGEPIGDKSPELAEINVGLARWPLDDPRMAGFVARLDEINRLADESPGFVWRLEDDSGAATAYRPYDALTLINYSIWTDVDAFKAYVYRSAHGQAMRDRRQWFRPAEQSNLAMWWVPAGQRPTLPEAVARLDHLREHGPSAHAFDLRDPFEAPERPGAANQTGD